MTMTIRRVTAAEVRPLRQLVLRPHQAVSELVYPGDDDPDSFHLAAFERERMVSIASVYRKAHADHAHPIPHRLRGMATHPDVRGTGVGGDLLEAALAACDGTHMWCNARTPAQRFYERHGFRVLGEAFEIRDIGPHVYMEREIRVL
jgi:predicted GNAT family N-acyltransferase